MSRDFDGSTGLLAIAATAVLRPSLPASISAWINPDALTAGSGIFTNNKTTTQHRGFWLALSSTSGRIEASFGNNLGTTGANRRSKVSGASPVITTGSWHQVVACYRGGVDMDIYIQGTDAGGTYSGTGGAPAYNTGIGSQIGSVGGIEFNGRIAEVAMWNVSLSAAEALALAHGVPPLKIRPESLIGYWPVWGASTTEIDLSGHLENATLSGTAPLANHASVGSPFPLVG